MTNDALRTILPVAGWGDECAREVEITVQLGGTFVRYLEIEFGELLLIERDTYILFTLQSRRAKGRLGDPSTLGNERGIALGGLYREVTFRSGLAPSRPSNFQLGICDIALGLGLTRVEHDQGALGDL